MFASLLGLSRSFFSLFFPRLDLEKDQTVIFDSTTHTGRDGERPGRTGRDGEESNTVSLVSDWFVIA